MSHWMSGVSRSTEKDTSKVINCNYEWVDEVADKLKIIKIKIGNDIENREIQTENK